MCLNCTDMRYVLLSSLLALGLTASAQIPDYVPTDGLVAWYPIIENINDVSGNGNDGINFGAELTTNRFGQADKALGFSEPAHVELPSSPISGAFSLSVWFEASQLDGDYILDSRVGSEMGFAFLLMSQTTLQFGFTAQGEYDGLVELSELMVGDSNWHHAVFVFEDNLLTLFLDDQLVYTGVQENSTFSSGGNIKLGVRHNYSGHWLNGKVDDVGIWSRGLSEEEVLGLYQSAPPAYGCTDSSACNFMPEANQDDGSCMDCALFEERCGPGTMWDESVQLCVVANPSDTDFDGCVSMTDLLDLLSVFGTCAEEESEEDPEIVEWSCGDPLEYQGYDYETVQIGDQCWFAENLRAENYRNGDLLESTLGDAAWVNSTAGAIATYGAESGCSNNVPDFDACNPELALAEFGLLYNGFSVDDERQICPTGWSVPTVSDWEDLEDYAGGYAQAGFKLKSSNGWADDGNGSNELFFGGKPGGYLWGLGAAVDNYQAGLGGYWWARGGDEDPSAFYLQHDSQSSFVSTFAPQHGFSIRCLKDSE